MEKQRCFGCMQLKSENSICEHCGYDAGTGNLPHQLKPGTVLQNQYVVGRALGQGGFGITYMGWDRFLDIPVAIKEFFPTGVVTRYEDSRGEVSLFTQQSEELFVQSRERFIREATSLARLGRNNRISNIVRIHNLVQANSTAYIIMEYVDGIDLRQYIRQKGGRLSIGQTMEMLLPLMEDLQEVHRNNIVHRDISPDNIMVLPDGTTKLIDFGAAYQVSLNTQGIQRSTAAILKHGFAPIEQYQSRGNLGSWTDVYALCATVYYCVTGNIPPQATDLLFGSEDFGWDRIPDLGAELIKTLKSGTALRKEDRIQTMAELRQSLLRAMEEKMVQLPQKPAVPASFVSPRGIEPYTAPLQYEPMRTVPVDQQQMTVCRTEPVETATVSVTVPVQRLPETERKAEPEEKSVRAPRKPGKKILLIPTAVAVAAVAVVAVLGMLLRKPEETPTKEAATVAVDPSQWMGNELRNTSKDVKRSGDEPVSVFGSKIMSDKIATVTFLDTLSQMPEHNWDVSRKLDGSVKAWAVPNGELYDLYIGAEGGINAGTSCRGLFYNYFNLERIRFNGAFHTPQVNSMENMFAHCTKLTQLDLSGFDTGSVTNMNGMFFWCEKLEQVDMTGINTRNVRDMGLMFSQCRSLASLDLSGFNTRNVTNMNYMFYGCNALEKLDVSGFDTGKVRTMINMFIGTRKLDNVDIPNMNTDSVYDAQGFMDRGDTLNGRDWKEYFTEAMISSQG